MFSRTPLATAIGLALATSYSGALAQEAPSEEVEDVVVVTGSRIRQDTFSSSTPMDVITAETASLQGVVDVGQLLQTGTVAVGSPQITPAMSTEFVENGGLGVQTLSLRGLGANRTLVLLNSRRAGPAGVRGGVSAFDFNVIPLTAIERVEILKDGASSIYGSDAVAGVVNVITRKDDGTSIDAYTSAPAESGGAESRVSVSWGKTLGRGYVRLTGDLYEHTELTRGDRDYFKCAEQYIFDPATGERADAIDPRTGSAWCADLLWGHVWIYDYQAEGGNVPTGAKAQFDYDADLGTYVPGFGVDPVNPEFMATPPGWFPVAYDRDSDGVANADHPFQDGESLEPKVERGTVMGEGEFDFTERLHGYAEFLLNRRKTAANGYRQYWSYLYNADSGGFFPANPLSAGWTGAQWLSPTPITDHNDDLVEVDYQRVVAGLSGDFADGWIWDVSYQWSESDGTYVGDIIYQDSIFDQNWLDGPCAGTPTSVRGVPCVDVPWLDPGFLGGDVPQDVREFLFGVDTGNTKYTQDVLEAYVTGDFGRLPGGAIGLAAGVQQQDDEIRDVPGENTLAGNVWGASTAGITAGTDSTTAYFAEVRLPLIAEKSWARDLTLTLSSRYTDVDSYGSDDTYKVGLNWQITNSWRVRANQGTSFRTPALFELYLADETSFLSQRNIDPCIRWGEALAGGDIGQRVADNCASEGIAPDFTGGAITATVITGGGYGILEAETSKSKTFGIVWQPAFADLNVSIDYFDITVNDEVDQLGADNVVYECYNSDFYPTDPLCTLFERRALDGGIDNIHDSFINIATQENTGFDFAVRWSTAKPWGTLTLDMQHTEQLEDKKGLFADTVIDYNGEIGDPERVARLHMILARERWEYFWGVNYVGPASNVESFGGSTATYRGETVGVIFETGSAVYHALSASRMFDGGMTLRFGVANATDEEPPRLTTLNLGEVDTVGRSAFYSQYDWLGRRFYLNFTKKW